jgi:ribosomal protein S18 acetylase RimI-like enzyme
MSLTDFTTEHPVEVRSSEVETKRFGFSFGRCSVPISSGVKPAEIARAIESRDADITVLRYPADRVTWFDQLARELGNRVLIHADNLVYWGLAVGNGRQPDEIEGIHTAEPADSEMIGDLTTAIFDGYSGHYTANPLLSASAADAGYRDWAMRTPLRDAVMLYDGGSPIGMATTQPGPDHVEILLAGVIPTHQGIGRYHHLLQGVENRARHSSTSEVVISTQAHNIAVQRSWARYGFLPMISINTLHVIRADIWAADHV